MVPEVCRIFCATANPTEVVLAETEQGKGILGVVDGFSPKGVEDEGDIKWRKDFLRQIKANRPSLAESVQLVATVAETLHYAHKQGIVIGTSNPATSFWTPAASLSWPISGWPCGSRMLARGRDSPGRRPT